MSLYLKYRPTSWKEIRGNSEVVNTLSNMVQDIENCPHAFLLHGETGCGKTTIARIITGELGCRGLDVIEVDSADFRGIDRVREIRQQSQFKPLGGERRAWIIDECHKMTNDAQNALLKILEDTPPHVYFILCTTDPQKLIKTIKGRCVQFQVHPLSDKLMRRLLIGIIKKEEKDVEEEVIQQIVRDSFGLPRNAIQILEQVLNTSPEQQMEVAKQTAEQYSESIELCRALIKGESWSRIAKILKGLKDQDPESIRRHVMGYAQSVLLGGESDQAARILEEFFEPFYNTGFPGLVYACYSVIKK